MNDAPGSPSTEDIYPDGIVFSKVLFDEIERFRISWETIDWDQNTHLSEHERKALTQAATQFQYGNMSHLLLCGKVMKAEVKDITLDVQKLALILASYKLEGIDIWGRYLRKQGAGADVSREMQRYYQHLFSESDAIGLLTGLSTLAGPVAHTLYKICQGQGDQLFNQITEQFITQKEREIELLTEYLPQIIQSGTNRPQKETRQMADTYQDIAIEILQTNDTTIDQLQLGEEEVHRRVTNSIDEFYAEIGLR